MLNKLETGSLTISTMNTKWKEIVYGLLSIALIIALFIPLYTVSMIIAFLLWIINLLLKLNHKSKKNGKTKIK